jgi:hypothetical protein
MLLYETTKIKTTRFLALTSLHVEEFEFLLQYFSPISDSYFRWHTLTGKARLIPRYEPRKNESLASNADKLFFVLCYLKGNAIQEIQGASFGLSQGKVSRIFKILSSLLEKTLKSMNLIPARTSEELQKILANHPSNTFSMDVTERSIARNVDYEAQKEDYSGKKRSYGQKQYHF